eukprot:CAMPEP_0172698628 /NCGR_PEP_ID=MMETSP1074-20121228/29614_1 /TAXON_ID=2916 /ORGANISM="Ceratium fusus, Strain PA161109" /LENGTH=155 /DNA_ID=CAMNT_0013519701 /DNA_START=45 /DNA_END=512 /DNA_ORIENTATION=-
MVLSKESELHDILLHTCVTAEAGSDLWARHVSGNQEEILRWTVAFEPQHQQEQQQQETENEQQVKEELQQPQRGSCLDPVPLPLDIDVLQLLGGRTVDHRQQNQQRRNMTRQTMQNRKMAGEFHTFLKQSWENACTSPQECGLEAALQRRCRFLS